MSSVLRLCLGALLFAGLIQGSLSAQDLRIEIVREPSIEPGGGPPVTPAESSATGDESELEEGQRKFTGQIDVKLNDGGSVKLAIKPQAFDFHTPYGKLAIPADEIRLIELAPRVPDEVAKQIEEAVANLASPQFEIREKAVADLEKVGPIGFPLLVRAAKGNKDPEVAARLSDVIEKLRDKLPEEQAEPRQWDIVHTGLCRIAGKLEMNTLAAESPQFGKVDLKLSDVRDLHFQGIGFSDVDISKLEPAPHNMSDKGYEIGKTYTYRVKGNARGGSVYGTDVYTLDSNLATAAVHAGVVKDGLDGVLRVKIVASPEMFVSSTRNGITSSSWTRYPAAYKVLKTRW